MYGQSLPPNMRWFWRRGGGTILKQAALGGGEFFTGKQQQSREFDVSDLSSIPWLEKRKEFEAIPREGLFDIVAQ